MKNKSAILLIILVALGFYALTLRGAFGNPTASDFIGRLDQNGSPFELSPERGRFVHLIALGENHTYALNQALAEAAYPDVGYHGDKYFSFFAPGIAYMALPFYLLGRSFNLSQVFSFAFISLMSVFALVFLYKIAREILMLPVAAALLAVLIFAFGSPAWSYAITLYQHHVTVFFMLSSFYAVWKYRQEGKYSWLWAAFAWLDYGLAFTIDYPNALLLMPIIIYLVIASFKITRPHPAVMKISVRSALFTSFLVFAAITALHLSYNQHYLGSWHSLNGGLPNYQSIIRPKQATSTPESLSQPVEKDVVGFFRESQIPKGFNVLIFSKDRGIFVFAPIFLLAFFGIYTALRKKISLENMILLSLVCVNVLLYSSWGDPWGGWAFGPRYLIPSMAILSLFIGVFLAKHRTRLWVLVGVFFLFAYSSAVAILGAATSNANPARNEALALHTGYNFLRNLDFMQQGLSGSFAYNNYFSRLLTLKQYIFGMYIILLLILLMLFLALVHTKDEPEAKITEDTAKP